MIINDEILRIEEQIELEKRGLGLRITNICEKIKYKYKLKYPNLTTEQINQKSRKEIFKAVAKETKQLRSLRIKLLLESE